MLSAPDFLQSLISERFFVGAQVDENFSPNDIQHLEIP